MGLSKKHEVASTSHRSEKDVARDHLGDFQVDHSRGLDLVEMMCPGTPLVLDSLKKLGFLCESLTGIRFERDFQRQRALIYKWFNDHYEELLPFVQVLHFDTESVII
jgi:hypothetical protein